MAVRRQPQPVAALQDENTQITRGNNANAIAAKSGSLEKAQQHQANAWADYEGRIEKVQFCGEDMEAMKENISKEEVNRRVAQALSYQTDIPCFLSRAFQKDPPEIKDFLELDCVEDLNNKGNSTCYDMKLQVMDVDYDESFLDWLEIILQNASKYWPALIEEHLW
jgi:hypothetical protein